MEIIKYQRKQIEEKVEREKTLREEFRKFMELKVIQSNGFQQLFCVLDTLSNSINHQCNIDVRSV